jgi:1-deoxyxylulose-5-phosphate synthase
MKNLSSKNGLNRRQFLRTSTAALAGGALLSPWVSNLLAATTPAVKRTAADQVTLGKTGIKLSRLGMGTGSSNGQHQTALGKEGFRNLIHYAYDHGVTYIDTADSYDTFGWISEAIKGLPREKLFIQSKVRGNPQDALAAIDRHRKIFDTDYVDSLLVHCMVKDKWTDDYKRLMDAFDEAKEKKWIRAKGVSCHSLPALRTAVASDWHDTHLVRVNPQGRHLDGEAPEAWNPRSKNDVTPVVEQLKNLHAKGRGVIAMKIIGNGDFTNAEDREKSIRFAMSRPEINAVVIGFTSPAQIDEAIERINRALAEA